MDFFQRQEIARRNTKLLEVYFVLAVIGTVLAIYLGMVVILNFQQDHNIDAGGSATLTLWDPQMFTIVSLVTIFSTLR